MPVTRFAAVTPKTRMPPAQENRESGGPVASPASPPAIECAPTFFLVNAFVVLICVVLGLAVGSFLNVVIARVPRRESVVRPPSHCPNCDTAISPRDNIPLVSWLILRGKCRHCAWPIPARYPLVELTNALAFGLVAWKYPESWLLLPYLVLTAALVALSVIDIEHFLLPNRIVYPLAVAMPILLAVATVGDDVGWSTWGRAVAGGFAGFAVYLFLNLVNPRGMAFGDVKLSFPISVALAYLGWGELLLGHFAAFLLGAVVGVALMIVRKKGRKDPVPFGPFMAAGTLFTLLWGPQFLSWYLHR